MIEAALRKVAKAWSIRRSLLPMVLVPVWMSIALAQSYVPEHTDPLAEPWRIQSYDELKGFGVYHLFEGLDGKIWVATTGGVSRFDGRRWHDWTVADGLFDPVVWCVIERADGSVLCGFRRGLMRLEGDAWVSVPTGPQDITWGVNALHEDRRGTLWIVTRFGVFTMTGQDAPLLHCGADSGQALRSLGFDLPIAPIPDLALRWTEWRRGLGFELGKLSVGWFVAALSPEGPAARAGIELGDRVSSMQRVVDPDREAGADPRRTVHRISFRHPGSGPLRADITTEEVLGVQGDFHATSLVEDGEGNLVFGLRPEGIVTCRRADSDSELTWSAPHGATDSRYSTVLARSTKGAYWEQSTEGNRLIRHLGAEVQQFDLPPEASIEDITEARDGTPWIVTDIGIFSWEHDRWVEHANPFGQNRARFAVATSDGHIWFGDAPGALKRVDVSGDRLESLESLRFIGRDTGGSEWFVTEDGDLAERLGGEWVLHDRKAVLGARILDAVAQPNGEVLAVGMTSEGTVLARWNGDVWVREVLPFLDLPSSLHRLISSASDGEIWIGPGHDEAGLAGVLCCRNGSWHRITSLLLEGSPMGIVAGGDGSAWLATNRGIYKVIDSQIRETPLPERVERGGATAACLDVDGKLWIGTFGFGFYRLDGERWTEFLSENRFCNNVSDIDLDGDGVLWATTRAGLSRFDGHKWRGVLPWYKTSSLRVASSTDGSVWVQDVNRTTRYRPERLCPDSTIEPFIDSLTPSSQVRISWTGCDPWQPAATTELTWSYRLDHGTWSPFTEETSRVLGPFAVGEHVLEVRSRDRDFNVDPTPAVASFAVVRPVWQQAWFVGMILLLLLAVGCQSFRLVRRGRNERESAARAEAAEAARARIEREVEARRKSEAERLRLESQLLQAQKLEAVGQLAGGVAHDFNNILTAILGNASELSFLLEENPLRDPRILAAVEGIRHAGERAAALTRQLLTVGRRQVTKPVVLDPNSIIADMGAMLERIIPENIRLALILSAAAGCIRIDRSMFEQVVMNLVVNARDAMASGGTIEIRTNRVLLTEDDLSSQIDCRPGHFFQLSVEDEGAGMAEKTIARVFEPFYSTKPVGKGSGLGLSTVTGIVRQSAGFITVRSELAKGSVFEVFIPSTERSTEGQPALGTVFQAPLGTERVLVCEDEPAVLQLIHRALSRSGYEVLTASSGEEALKLISTIDQPPELLLTDMIMSGMNGRDLAGTIRKVHPEIALLYMSGHAADILDHRGELEGDVEFLQKPFTVSVLLEKVRAVLDGR
ncbi:MAG: ATP-binding protein [Planctomycetota bacterium]